MLFGPLAEVVIHDINQNNIVYIKGNLSRRKIGDKSLLDAQPIKDLGQIIYSKVNFDGRLIKSISIIIEEKWMVCINCDVSIFSQMQELSKTMLKIDDQASSLFAKDWQEKLHFSIHKFLTDNKLSLDNLSQSDKKNLTKHLFGLGAFHEKKSADYVAKFLGLSRATIFNYLKEWRNR